MKGSKQKGAKARGKSSSKAIEKIPKLPEYKVHKELSPKEISRLAIINMPIVARYQDDGGIAVNLNLDDDSPYIRYSSAEIANTLNELARLSKARKGSIGKEELLTKLNASLSIFTGMKPKDSVEAMMITQMIALHEMALLSSERALLTEQPAEFVEQNVNRATKLCRTYALLAEALNKYRNKGQQKITVQHVNVNDGGQAVIGDINQGEGNG